MKRGSILMLVAASVYLSACVSQKKFNATANELKQIKEQVAGLNAGSLNCEEEKKRTIARMDVLQQHLETLLEDSSKTHAAYDKVSADFTALEADNERLLKEKNDWLASAGEKLKQWNDDLQKKQIELDKKQGELENKELSINALTNDVKMRSQRLRELQSQINAKDSIMNALRRKIELALQGFDNSELTIERRNGKVYVSMSEKLLFASGSAEIDVKGKEALRKLAEVLTKNPDIQITVEGHTDNAELRSASYPRNNWDLSVLRSTTIIRVLTEGKLDPARITAAGHGEYFPIADNKTKDGRAKNRRTEIILTPNLDEIQKLIDQQ